MKTPDEIKKGLFCEPGTCEGCPYERENCEWECREDALDYIQQLERERDALLKDISSVQGCICIICKNYNNPNPGTGTSECKIVGRFKDRGFDGALTCGQFEWRGVEEE